MILYVRSIQKKKTRCDYNLPIIKSPKLAPNTQGTLWSVLLNVSNHKEYRYNLFKGRNLNSFPGIKPFMKWTG